MAHDGVALARRPLEPSALLFLTEPAAVVDAPAFLERTRREGDARALGPEHLSHELEGEHELVPVHRVMAEQQPPGEPGADMMGRVTGGGLAEHRHPELRVLQHSIAERRIARALLDEAVGGHPEPVARHLRGDLVQAVRRAEKEGKAGHALPADGRDLRPPPVPQRRDDRDEPEGREIRVLDRAARLDEDLVVRLVGLGTLGDAGALGLRQRGEDQVAVEVGNGDAGRHGGPPSADGPTWDGSKPERTGIPTSRRCPASPLTVRHDPSDDSLTVTAAHPQSSDDGLSVCDWYLAPDNANFLALKALRLYSTVDWR